MRPMMSPPEPGLSGTTYRTILFGKFCAWLLGIPWPIRHNAASNFRQDREIDMPHASFD